jgi:hypothetical protein
MAHNSDVADDAEGGHPLPGELPVPTGQAPVVVPDMEVFGDVTSLAASLRPDPDRPSESPAPAEHHSEPTPDPVVGSAGSQAITDEERNRYGLLLDRAAERGLLEPSEYEVRLRELAEATTTEQMMQIVTELPVFNASLPGTGRKKSRPPGHSSTRGAGGSGPRRRVTVWALLGLLVAVAVVSLVILAVSAERLTHRQGHNSGTAPVVTRSVSGPRL